jgi:hypothetical protein
MMYDICSRLRPDMELCHVNRPPACRILLLALQRPLDMMDSKIYKLDFDIA